MTMDNYLYLVNRIGTKCRIESEWDVFNSFVVCCKTEQEARETHPDGHFNKDDWDGWVPKEDIDLLNVTYLGIADVKTAIGVVLASFRAG